MRSPNTCTKFMQDETCTFEKDLVPNENNSSMKVKSGSNDDNIDDRSNMMSSIPHDFLEDTDSVRKQTKCTTSVYLYGKEVNRSTSIVSFDIGVVENNGDAAFATTDREGKVKTARVEGDTAALSSYIKHNSNKNELHDEVEDDDNKITGEVLCVDEVETSTDKRIEKKSSAPVALRKCHSSRS